MTKAPPKIKNIENKSGYRALVGENGWRKIHPAIQERFSEKIHQVVTYRGVMKEVYLSFAGKIFAHICRLIGTPLALYEGKDVPMEVKVYPNEKLKGMTWDRFYHYQNKPVNRVASTKCILPEGGLVEMVGFGFGMKLDVFEKNNAIVFESEEFFWKLGNKKIRIPNWMTPGKTTVRQIAINNKEFEFRLSVTHPFLGEVYRQIGVFKAEEVQKEVDQ